MIKRVLLSLIILSGNSLASGTFSVNQDLIEPNNLVTLKPTFSLYMLEHLGSEVFYQSWTGIRTNSWLVSDHSVMMPINNWTSFGLGPSFSRESGLNKLTIKAYMEVRLW